MPTPKANPRRRQPRRRLPRSRSPRSGSLRLALVLAVLVGVNLYVFLWRGGTSIPDVMEQAALAGQPGAHGEAPSASAVGIFDRLRADRRSALVELEGGADDAAVEPPEELGRWVEGEVTRGDSLGRILHREGLTPPEADELIRALEPHLDFRAIRVGQSYRMHFDGDGRVTEFEFHVSRIVTVRAARGPDGKLAGEKLETETEIRVNEVGGRIDSSLYATIRDQGEDTSLVSFFVDVFAYDLNFYIDTHRGDTFRMLVEKEYAEGEFLRYRRVLGAEYSGKAGTYRAFWWKPPDAKEGGYYDEKGNNVERSLLRTPLKYSRISSKFNPRRMHPILHKVRGHYGVDYAAPTGTPIWAASSGRIIFRGWRGGGGNTIIMRHDNGMQTVYMHMSRFARGQKVGDYVRAKTVIGYVGSTGMSTGPHLHFEVRVNGKHVDPLKMRMTRGTPVAARHRAQFEQDTSEVVGRLARIRLPGEQRAPAAEQAEPDAPGVGASAATSDG
jgi:murein DD-endopeptidase MepM/ murein hydrolase activator NlpD